MFFDIMIWLVTLGCLGSLAILIIGIVGLWNDRVSDFICDSVVFKVLVAASLSPMLVFAISLLFLLILTMIGCAERGYSVSGAGFGEVWNDLTQGL